MNIETATGPYIKNATEEQLHKCLAELNGDNDTLNLSDEEGYIQCAFSDTGFYAEYQDDSGNYTSASGLSAQSIKDIFTFYLSHSESWKTLTSWTPMELPADNSGQQQPPSFKDTLKEGLSPETLFGSVKRQVSREVAREASRKASGLLGKIIRKIIK